MIPVSVKKFKFSTIVDRSINLYHVDFASLDHSKDFDAVSIHVKHTQEQLNLSRTQWKAEQVKDLRSRMSTEKFQELLEKRLESGLYYKDLDFPDDPEERREG